LPAGKRSKTAQPGPRRALGDGRQAVRVWPWLIATVALAAVVAVAVAVFAMWRSGFAMWRPAPATPILTNGSLAAVAGSFEWAQTTPEAPAAMRASGIDAASLAAVRALPGDTFELRQGVVMTAADGNSTWDLTALWAESATAVPAGLTATYAVRDQAGKTVAGTGAGAPIGTPVLVSGRPGATEFTVVITVVYDGETMGARRPSAALPSLRLDARQVRGDT
jgi:hypothetical protein